MGRETGAGIDAVNVGQGEAGESGRRRAGTGVGVGHSPGGPGVGGQGREGEENLGGGRGRAVELFLGMARRSQWSAVIRT